MPQCVEEGCCPLTTAVWQCIIPCYTTLLQCGGILKGNLAQYPLCVCVLSTVSFVFRWLLCPSTPLTCGCDAEVPFTVCGVGDWVGGDGLNLCPLPRRMLFDLVCVVFVSVRPSSPLFMSMSHFLCPLPYPLCPTQFPTPQPLIRRMLGAMCGGSSSRRRTIVSVLSRSCGSVQSST